MMSQSNDIKIRALPRGAAKAKTTSEKPAAATRRIFPRWIIYVGSASVILLVSAFLLPNLKGPKAPKRSMAQAQQQDLSSTETTAVSRHLQESLMKSQMIRSQQRIDNLNAQLPTTELTGLMLEDDSSRSYGVQLDSEDTPERLFKDLNNRNAASVGDNLPDDRINARLANRKWVNQAEREERINFVRTFIRAAYDRGYAVEIDQNLVVVGVKKLNGDKKVNIDQVIDRMAKQGL